MESLSVLSSGCADTMLSWAKQQTTKGADGNYDKEALAKNLRLAVDALMDARDIVYGVWHRVAWSVVMGEVEPGQ